MKALKSFFHGVLFALGVTAVMAVTLNNDITETGMYQGDLVKFLQNVRDNVNELTTDHGTTKTSVDELNTLTTELLVDHATIRTELIAIGDTFASVKTIYEAHTHEAPGSSFAASRTSTPDTGAAENSLAASAASTITDSSGSSVPATVTAPAATAGPAALTNSTALTLSGG